jgi:Uma2 family endonuclease
MGLMKTMVASLDAKPKSIMPESFHESLLKLSVSQYHCMIAHDILCEDSQIELLEGLLTTKMPKNPPHRISTKLLRSLLEQIVPEGWYVDSQEPITLSDSEPEPDIAIIRGSTTDYRDRHPNAQDLAMVIEVADSSLERDRTIKQRIYARAGIPIFWILNLGDRTLEVYTQPSDQGIYQDCQVFQESASVAIIINQIEIANFMVGTVL